MEGKIECVCLVVRACGSWALELSCTALSLKDSLVSQRMNDETMSRPEFPDGLPTGLGFFSIPPFDSGLPSTLNPKSKRSECGNVESSGARRDRERTIRSVFFWLFSFSGACPVSVSVCPTRVLFLKDISLFLLILMG